MFLFIEQCLEDECADNEENTREEQQYGDHQLHLPTLPTRDLKSVPPEQRFFWVQPGPIQRLAPAAPATDFKKFLEKKGKRCGQIHMLIDHYNHH